MSETHQILALFVDTDPDSGYSWVEPYKPSEHLASAYKFLYWSVEWDVLVVGNPGITRHRVLREIAAGRYDYLMYHAPSGAGGIVPSGEVSDWHSSGFDLETPEYLRPIILKALGIEQGD